MAFSTAADGGFNSERKSVADMVLEDLESSILSGRLERGAKLPSEKELASYYGVSGPTIREVIRALRATQLVEVRHGSGATVAADSATVMASAMRAVVELEGIDLASILQLSETLNLQAVDLAIAQANDGEIAHLRVVAVSFHESMTSQEFTTTLQEFLTELVALSHNKLLDAVASFVISTHLSIARAVRSGPESQWASDVARLREVRIEVVDAIAARDRQRAFTAVREYTRQAREVGLATADQKPK